MLIAVGRSSFNLLNSIQKHKKVNLGAMSSDLVEIGSIELDVSDVC